MKIAIPLFKDRVSPHFGASSTFLFLETDGATICRKVTRVLKGEGPMEVARRLSDLGVEEIVCGGIQNRYKEWLIRKGIMVMENRKGTAMDVIKDLLGSQTRRKDVGICEGDSGNTDQEQS